ncbi:MAG: hypothetical protein ACWA5P_13940 [bacterium]
MKKYLILKSYFITILSSFFFITVTSQIYSQEQIAELKEFKIIIEKTDNEIKMQSSKGSSWMVLSFNLNDFQSIAIDEYGMTSLNNISKIKKDNLADFLFTVSKTKNGVKLIGIEGVAWHELSFSLAKGSKQTINQFGMTSL